jgi:two-component system OmpR family response regulator
MPRICKVLVVEGHEGVRALLGDALHDRGYRFTLVDCGAAMQRALDEDDYEIVLIDVALRDEDGMALADDAAAQGCGVILTTGDRRHFDQVERSRHRHIFKPFMIGALLRVVEEVLREVAARCVRRKRRDGSLFPLRTP